MTQLVIYVLAVWRLSHMVVQEDGPADFFAWFRDWLVATPWVPEWLARASQCVSCTSVWAAFLLLVIDHTPLRWVRWVLAGSAVAKLVEDYFYDTSEVVPYSNPFLTDVEDGRPLRHQPPTEREVAETLSESGVRGH